MLVSVSVWSVRVNTVTNSAQVIFVLCISLSTINHNQKAIIRWTDFESCNNCPFQMCLIYCELKLDNWLNARSKSPSRRYQILIVYKMKKSYYFQYINGWNIVVLHVLFLNGNNIKQRNIFHRSPPALGIDFQPEYFGDDMWYIIALSTCREILDDSWLDFSIRGNFSARIRFFTSLLKGPFARNVCACVFL